MLMSISAGDLSELFQWFVNIIQNAKAIFLQFSGLYLRFPIQLIFPQYLYNLTKLVTKKFRAFSFIPLEINKKV